MIPAVTHGSRDGTRGGWNGTHGWFSNEIECVIVNQKQYCRSLDEAPISTQAIFFVLFVTLAGLWVIPAFVIWERVNAACGIGWIFTFAAGVITVLWWFGL